MGGLEKTTIFCYRCPSWRKGQFVFLRFYVFASTANDEHNAHRQKRNMSWVQLQLLGQTHYKCIHILFMIVIDMVYIMLRSILARNSNTSETANLVRTMSASHMSPAEVATVDDMQKKGMAASAVFWIHTKATYTHLSKDFHIQPSPKPQTTISNPKSFRHLAQDRAACSLLVAAPMHLWHDSPRPFSEKHNIVSAQSMWQKIIYICLYIYIYIYSYSYKRNTKTDTILRPKAGGWHRRPGGRRPGAQAARQRLTRT